VVTKAYVNYHYFLQQDNKELRLEVEELRAKLAKK
jgi:cell division septum initiation protein DivIVA